MVPDQHYLILSAVLFVIGVLGVLTRKNIMIILLSIELMLNASNLSFVTFSKIMGNLDGQIVSLFVIAIAASEVAVGLAIAVLMFKHQDTVDPTDMNLMKW